jgi:hypothetical protein
MHSYGTPPLRNAFVSAVAAPVVRTPLAPESLPRLAVELSSGLFGMAATSSGRSALVDLRASLFTLYGQERQARGLWHQSLATAAFAELLARSNGASVATVTLGGLLHRAGEACELRTADRSPAWAAGTLETPVGARVANTRAMAYAAELVRDWQLPPEVAECLTGWHRCPELDTPGTALVAIYCGHLLAVELLHPELCASGAVGAAVVEQGFAAGTVAKVAAGAPRVRELLRALG